MSRDTELFRENLERFLDHAEAKSFSLSHSSNLPTNTEIREVAQMWRLESDASRSATDSSSSRLNLPALPFRIGNYLAQKTLGEGGFGKVLLARDMATHQEVAIKLLHKDRGAAKSLFLREAYLLSQLNHRSIISFREFGYFEEHPFYVMEHVEGCTLASMIHSAQKEMAIRKVENPLEFQVASPNSTASSETYGLFVLRAAREIAEALNYCHQRGVLHRDLKPNNILVKHDGRVLLTDFGLAEREGSDFPSQIAGTYAYMSPEQAHREVVDSQADIFSFGATFYEAITLKRAFEGHERDQLIVSILHSNPTAPRRVNPQIDANFESILLKCLAKKKSERYQSVDELVRDLRSCASGEVAVKAKARRLPWIAASMVGAAILSCVAYGNLVSQQKIEEIVTPVAQSIVALPEPQLMKTETASVEVPTIKTLPKISLGEPSFFPPRPVDIIIPPTLQSSYIQDQGLNSTPLPVTRAPANEAKPKRKPYIPSNRPGYTHIGDLVYTKKGLVVLLAENDARALGVPLNPAHLKLDFIQKGSLTTAYPFWLNLESGFLPMNAQEAKELEKEKGFEESLATIFRPNYVNPLSAANVIDAFGQNFVEIPGKGFFQMRVTNRIYSTAEMQSAGCSPYLNLALSRDRQQKSDYIFWFQTDAGCWHLGWYVPELLSSL